MRIDAHQHFWAYNSTDYVWMGPGMDILRQDHGPADLKPHLDAVQFDGTVAVQARQMEAETDYLLALASEVPWIRGVVGWVDFSADDLPARMEAYAAFGKLRGFRELIHDMDDPDYAVSPDHLRGVGLLARYGLTYDLLLRPQHLAAAIRLLDQLPQQPFVIDHIAKPRIGAEWDAVWDHGIREIARRPNVCCKLSGMVTEAAWHRWSAADFAPYLDLCLHAFGPERLMIGSDWPVCTLAGSYEAVMGIVIDYASRLSEDERDAILGGTCARFYGL